MREVIRFLSAEGVKTVDIIRRIQDQYGDNCFSLSKIYKWIDYFEREELLYAMRRDQEGRQCQDMRTVFKTLTEWYGKTNHSGRH